jgi:hypothetical protein
MSLRTEMVVSRIRQAFLDTSRGCTNSKVKSKLWKCYNMISTEVGIQLLAWLVLRWAMR